MHECDIMTGLVVYKKSDALFTGTHDIVAQAEKLDYNKWIEEGNRTWCMKKILESPQVLTMGLRQAKVNTLLL